MQHDFSSEEPTTSGYLSSASNPMVQARIDAYLDRTCAPLFRTLPQEEALEQLAEMRSHLESMVAAYVELGSSEIEAVSLALEQFGNEQSVAHAWKEECEETKVEAGRGSFWCAIKPVVGYSVLNWMALPVMLKVYTAMVNGYYQTGRAVPGLLTAAAVLVFCAEYALFPGLLGYLAGRRARGKTLVASVLALPLIQLLCMSSTALISVGLFGATFSAHSMSEMLGGSLVGDCVSFLGIGILGAGIAVRRRKKTLQIARNR